MGIIMKDGHQYGFGSVLETVLQFESTGWTSTETVNDVTYYTQSVSVQTIGTGHPDIGIAPITGVLPTTDEQTAYDAVNYFTVDHTNKAIKGYAETAPSNTFAIIVKGVA